jgi:hypothetical protein
MIVKFGLCLKKLGWVCSHGYLIAARAMMVTLLFDYVVQGLYVVLDDVYLLCQNIRRVLLVFFAALRPVCFKSESKEILDGFGMLAPG